MQRRPRVEVGARNRNEAGISPVRGEKIFNKRQPSIVDLDPVAGAVNISVMGFGFIRGILESSHRNVSIFSVPRNGMSVRPESLRGGLNMPENGESAWKQAG